MNGVKTWFSLVFSLVLGIFLSCSVQPVENLDMGAGVGKAMKPKALTTPKVPVSGNPVNPYTSIFSKIVRMPGGADGSVMVAEVDMSKISTYRAESTDPDWVKYYMSFFVNGVYQPAVQAGSAAQGPVGYLDSQVYPVSPNAWNSMSIGSSYPNFSSFVNQGSSYYPNYTWYDARPQYNQRTKATGQTMYVWFDHHYRKKSGVLTPTFGTAGEGYRNLGVDYGATTAFRILFDQLVVLRPADFTYYEVSYQKEVMAGEVTPDGWGIVPMTNSRYVPWIFIKPSTAICKVFGRAGACPGKTCSYNCQVGMCDNYCRNSSGLHVPHIFNPALLANTTEIGIDNAMDGTMSCGGGSAPDLANNTKVFYVDPSSDTVQEIVDVNDQRLYAGYTGWIDVNGSMNTLSQAEQSAMLKANAKGKPLVLVYMAQDIGYAAANETAIRSKLSDLFNNYSRSYGNNVIVTSHSFSGHIVESLMKNITSITHYAFNPAQGNWSAMGGPNYTATYVNDLNSSSATTVLVCGQYDLVSRFGGGCGWYDSTVGWVRGNDSVYNADQAKGNVSTTLINNATHSIESMYNNGAMSIVSVPR